MTVRHVVVFRFHPGTPADRVEALRSELVAFSAALEPVLTYDVGEDLGVNEASWDFAVSATFADVEGYLAYRDDPEHQRIIRELVAPITAERASVQLAI
ncbi:MAG: Dabb family protein [Acidimicrobiales bacterium]|nr:Dabb family protein [Acidimicrobiales bacterium]